MEQVLKILLIVAMWMGGTLGLLSGAIFAIGAREVWKECKLDGVRLGATALWLLLIGLALWVLPIVALW